MLKPRSILISLTVFFLLFFSSSALNQTFAYYTNMPAGVVVGQPDFTRNGANQGGSVAANTLNANRKIASDGTHLFVADTGNNRVLIFNEIPTHDNQNADVVIGQTSFTGSIANQGGSANSNTLSSPVGVSTDGNRLFIADTGNSRILIYNSIPTTNDASADIVVGQTGMTGSGGSTSSSRLSSPQSVSFDPDTGKLIITDSTNNRVLIYSQVPTANGASADVVVGQLDLTHSSGNQGGATPTASTLFAPSDARIYKGKLYVADPLNRRVLIWNTVPTTDGASADVVIGQPNFTSNSDNQGLSSAAANTNRRVNSVSFHNDRLVVADLNNRRFLVFNNLPTTNNVSADMVLGQADFSGMLTNQGADPDANTIGGSPDQAIQLDGKIILSDRGNNRILILYNVLSSPGMSVSTVDSQTEGKVRLSGTIRLGEKNRYSLQTLQASVNGQGWGDVTHRDGGRDDGTDSTLYEFYHDFEPWAGIGSRDTYDPASGYTVKLHASSYNAEDDNLFYFQPFNLNSVSGSALPMVSFNVNKTQWQRLKDNLDSFEVQVKKEGSAEWTTYADQIPVSDDSYDANAGTVSLTVRPKSGISLTAGKHSIKVVAKDKRGHRQETNTLESTLTGLNGSAYNPLKLAITNQWFPLQVNKINGVRTGILASFNPSAIGASYTASSSIPMFEGVAFSGATVAINVTDTKTGKTKLYTTKAENSIWKLRPTLYPSSQVDVSVYDDAGRYNELLPLSIKVVQPVLTATPEQ